MKLNVTVFFKRGQNLQAQLGAKVVQGKQVNSLLWALLGREAETWVDMGSS